ncbi:MAG TPA: hypothetical protein VFQ13_05385 [Anaerolineales bacterium]|nr:hypothetical protein [Anaerolineales bacterium]
MEKKSWEKIEWLLFIIAIILVLLLSALFVYFENIITGGAKPLVLVLKLLNQILPGLIGTLIVVIFIYIFLKSKGIDANEQFRGELVSDFINRAKTEISPKNIDSLVQKIASYKGARFLRLEHSKELFQFSEKLKTAKAIWINGYSCAQLFKEFRSEMERALIKGTDFKIIITEPHSVAAKMMEERDVHPGRVVVDINYVVSEINAIKGAISKTKNKKTGSIDVKFIDWLPSCSMIFYNPDEEDGEVKIKVYPPCYSTNHFNPIEMLIDRKNYQDQFAYFHEQYNRLWNREINKSRNGE